MKKYFRTLQSVLDSRWGNFQYAGIPTAQKTDRILQSSKLEDCIYRDLSKMCIRDSRHGAAGAAESQTDEENTAVGKPAESIRFRCVKRRML